MLFPIEFDVLLKDLKSLDSPNLEELGLKNIEVEQGDNLNKEEYVVDLDRVVDFGKVKTYYQGRVIEAVMLTADNPYDNEFPYLIIKYQDFKKLYNNFLMWRVLPEWEDVKHLEGSFIYKNPIEKIMNFKKLLKHIEDECKSNTESLK